MKIKKVAQTPGVLATVSTSKIDSDKDTYSCNYLNDNAVVVSPTEPIDGKVWFDDVNKTIHTKNGDIYEEFLNKEQLEEKTEYLTIKKMNIGSNASVNVATPSNIGNRTMLIAIYGKHIYGVGDYTLRLYLLRVYGQENNLIQVYESQSGAVNLTLEYLPGSRELTVTNSGNYGCEISVTFL